MWWRLTGVMRPRLCAWLGHWPDVWEPRCVHCDTRLIDTDEHPTMLRRLLWRTLQPAPRHPRRYLTMRTALRSLLAAAFALFVLIGLAGHVSAGVLQDDPVVPDSPGLTIPEVAVSVLVGLALPVVYGIFVRPSNPELVKVLGGILVAAVASLVMNAIQADGTAVLSWQQVVDTALVFIPQVAGYLGVWKPLDINARTGPGIAIGRGSTPQPG